MMDTVFNVTWGKTVKPSPTYIYRNFCQLHGLSIINVVVDDLEHARILLPENKREEFDAFLKTNGV
jgi:hypothetical protein